MKVYVIVDAQNDFVTGALRNEDAIKVVPYIREKLGKINFRSGDRLIFTKDTHYDGYLGTLEGKYLPIPHCIDGTDGWEIVPELLEFSKDENAEVLIKNVFGSIELGEILHNLYPTEVEFMGFCTDICVVSNVLIAKAALPDTKVIVDSRGCAGLTPEKHEAALEVMRSCQVEVI